MIEKSIIIEIEKLLDNKKIIDSKLLSDSFGINCLKIVNEDNKKFIVKYYHNKIYEFNAIKSEIDNLIYSIINTLINTIINTVSLNDALLQFQQSLQYHVSLIKSLYS